MDRVTRSELLKTVDSQKDQLQRYEKRLRDVVVAYKSLTKEKEALETSLKALSTTTTTHAESEDSATTAPPGGSDPLNATDQASVENDVSQTEVLKLKEQLATLTNAMTTLNQEKSKMDSTYQAEKKQLRQSFQEKLKKLEEEKTNSEGIAQEFQEQVLELKAKLRTQQYEREKEQNDHAVMLKEIQKKLSEERILKEMVEHQLEETRQKLFEKESAKEITDRYEKKISNMAEELEAVRLTLKSSQQKANEPSPLLLQLQKEMAEMKAQHRIQVQDEQMRRQEAEDRVGDLSEQNEERVSGLEAKLSELSEVVGKYERLRYTDQAAIQKLRERVTQLDLENTALARVAHGKNSDEKDTNDEGDDDNLDVQSLLDKMTKLKGLLKLANQRSERPINIDELLQPAPSIEDDNTTHKRCQEELSQLKEEFERYKLRAQSVLKNKSIKDSTSKEIESLKHQLSDVKDRLKTTYVQHEESENQHKSIVADLRKTITCLKQQQDEKLQTANLEYEKRASELELQLHKHRDRTIALLAEKDREIELLKMSSPTHKAPLDHRSMAELSVEKRQDDTDNQSVSDMIRHMTVSSSNQNDTVMLHFAHEQARKDVEINALRKQKHDAETAIRELQQSMIGKAEDYNEQIDSLKEDVRRLERNKSRESANLEYLKNVVYKFMISNDSHCKQQMLNAISTILEFSPKEKHNVEHYMNSWWGYTPDKNK
ncbi:GRIP and coiled-coil domain-containing protein 1-like [Tubulanus polymorphus]|uniref:GRIP and coiled-coil domain-containing protein 1-like n=1 Tax=Tubulanus polymorphus TaxID=672921 RepID=UPI003DA3D161